MPQAIEIEGLPQVLAWLEEQKRGGKLRRSLGTRIRSIVNYTAVALTNEPKRVKSAPPKKITSSSAHYRAAAKENTIWIPDGAGGIRDTGLTVAQYLKKIKGAYRATGSGSYLKEKVQTRVKGSYPPGTYAERNQRPGEFFRKGTGRFSDDEWARIAENRRKLDTREREIQAKAREADDLELRKYNRQLVRIAHQKGLLRKRGEERRAAVASAIQKKRAKYEERRAQLRRAREEHTLYRIVKPDKGYTDTPLPVSILRKGAPAGSPPKSWPGGGRREYFISKAQRNGQWVGNWKVSQVGDFAFTISLTPLPKQSGESDSDFLRRLEYGGSVQTTRRVMGYLLNTEGRSKSHRRISRLPLRGGSKQTHVAPRPFVAPVLERIRKKFRTN